DVTQCKQNKNKDQMYKKWAKYIRDPAIRVKMKLPGTLSSPLTMNILVTAPNAVITTSPKAATRIAVARTQLKLTHTGSLKFQIPFTKQGLPLMRRWLAADRRFVSRRKRGKKPPAVWLTDLVTAG